jgi:NAD(P)-dependent dehydrogenase (short-subunit alcohol dehydrogenase family)
MAEARETARVVVITGGSSGIGRAMAEAFAWNGDQVVIIGRNEDALLAAAQALGPQCTWQRADISQSEQVEAAVNAIAARFGGIDVLINNAGYSGFSRGLTADTPLDQARLIWDEVISVNLTGAFLAVAPHLSRPGGRIIYISSDAALTGGAGLRLAGYAAAKAGLLGLTRALALEYGPQGITVNAIAPGFIAGTGANQYVPEETVKSIAAQLPVRRAGHVQDVAAAALFLAAPNAGFITGEVLNVNGGRVFGR